MVLSMPLLLILLILATVAGHAALWIAFVNHIHGLALPRPLMRGLTACAYSWLAAGPVLLALWLLWAWPGPTGASAWLALPWGLVSYGAFCCALAAGPLPLWFWQRLTVRRPWVLRSNHTASLDLAHTVSRSAAGGPWARLTRLPGNEILRLDVNEKTIDVPGLPPALDELSIVHMSDLHFTGRVGQEYFREVVRLANELEPDLVALTGDLVDKSHCIPWVAPTLGRLFARYGAYYVLGNHDLRVDVTRLRAELAAAGLIALGGTWRRVEIDGQSIALAGNELPWIAPTADVADCPRGPRSREPFRVLLSHSPDQYAWARKQKFDLMLAGHTHGGQIQIPLLGPIVAPSRHGVRYASGTFYEPPTVLHVSRGLSGLLPLRINCRPELTKLVLRAEKNLNA
jgi:uncharacterized protein